MRSTRIITAFLRNDGMFLIVRRSHMTKSMQGMWSGISGIIEGNEDPLRRAEIEIREELGMRTSSISLVRSAGEIRVRSPQYENHEWRVFPFLFSAESRTVRLNWENMEYRWIKIDELSGYETVPDLSRVLYSLL